MKINNNRRTFLKQTAVLGALPFVPFSASAFSLHDSVRLFGMSLNGGAIGVKAGQQELIKLAAKYGFEAVAPSPGELSGMDEQTFRQTLDLLKQNRLQWGNAGLPVDFRKDVATFEKGLEKLKGMVPRLKAAGVTRMGTWIFPNHQELTYLQNFELHSDRLRQIARVLETGDIRLGLEYVGPRTLWSAGRYPFLHSLAETLELIERIGTGNVGLVLDSFHWFNAEETREDLLVLKNEQVVACDLNDAVGGLAASGQRDLYRELPTATGVIDIKTFLEALVQIGYDGPVRAEPFSRSLNILDDETAVAATAQAMKQAFGLIG